MIHPSIHGPDLKDYRVQQASKGFPVLMAKMERLPTCILSIQMTAKRLQAIMGKLQGNGLDSIPTLRKMTVMYSLITNGLR